MTDKNAHEVFFLYWRSEFWLQAALQQARKLASQGTQFTVVDMSHFHYPRQAPWRLSGKWVSPGGAHRALSHIFEEFGAHFTVLEVRKAGDGFPPTPSVKQSLETAVQSSLNNCFRQSYSNGLGALSRLVKARWLSKASSVKLSAERLLTDLGATRVSIVNGRLFSQFAVALAAQNLSISVTFLEHSEFPGHLFSRSYRPHDRVAFQRDVEKFARSEDRETIERLALEWENLRRKVKSTTNPFSVRWKATSSEKLQNARIALFLTSSSDEFESLDLDWKEGQWSDQYEGFDFVLKSIGHLNLIPVLRIHPNLANKSPIDALAELKKVGKLSNDNPALRLVDHASRVSTYELLKDADLVVVYNSTVGLEASMMGKHVVCLNSCWYDDIAEVFKLHRRDQINLLETYLTNPVDSWQAKRWPATQMLQDRRISSASPVLIRQNLLVQITRAIVDGSLLWIMFELRWKLFKKIMLSIRVSKKRFQ